MTDSVTIRLITFCQENGLQDESLRLVLHEQNGQWQTADHPMARRRRQDISQGSNRRLGATGRQKQRIRQDLAFDGNQREDTRLPGHDNWFFSAR